jgi:hypothetical protein
MNMPSASVNFKDDDLSSFDVIMAQRKCNLQNSIQNNMALGGVAMGNIVPTDAKMMLPPELERQYQVFIINGPNAKKQIARMREIKAN